MYYTKGVFGVLNLESLPDEPMVLLDGGIESRYKEDYFFDNSCRSIITVIFFNIHCLGAVLMNLMAKLFFLLPAQPFLLRSPKKAAIICLRKPINHGNFSIFILMEALFFLFLKSLRSTAAVLFQLTRRQAAFKRRLLFIHA